MNKSAILLMLTVYIFLPEFAVADLIDNGNGTVTDRAAGLTWQQCSAGQSGANCATGAAAAYTWDNAILFCEGLSLAGFTDWRLPNSKELRSIVDPARGNYLAINTAVFPATQASYYWSSTSYAPGTNSAWGVTFSTGYVNVNSKLSPYYVRCVR